MAQDRLQRLRRRGVEKKTAQERARQSADAETRQKALPKPPSGNGQKKSKPNTPGRKTAGSIVKTMDNMLNVGLPAPGVATQLVHCKGRAALPLLRMGGPPTYGNDPLIVFHPCRSTQCVFVTTNDTQEIATTTRPFPNRWVGHMTYHGPDSIPKDSRTGSPPQCP